MTNKPIGLLDSGVGGLTVLKAVKERLPNESFVYIGDTLRCPYGNRTREEIVQYTLELAHFLVKQQVKLIVIACNTATAQALEAVRKQVDIPVVGVIFPGSEAAAKTTTSKEVGVLATKSTVESGFYEETLYGLDSDLRVKSLACPSFVDLVEQNKHRTETAKKTVEKTLLPFKTEKMDTLILGCTHFPLLAPHIQKVMGEDVTLIDSGAVTSVKIQNVLEKENLMVTEEHKPFIRIYTTDSVNLFQSIASEWLETDQFTIQTISLERLTR